MRVESRFENKKHQEEKPDTNEHDTKQEGTEDGIQTINDKSERLVSLKSLLTYVESNSNEWPGRVLEAILQRFGRMPRGGWDLTPEVYDSKFSSTPLYLQELKQKSRARVTTEGSQQTSNMKFLAQLQTSKRMKTIKYIVGECSLKEAALDGKIKNLLFNCIKSLEEKK
ncbi:uncharacterized protein VNE69_12139 [Vairimorpha necatrix]|uniref:Uncharacterized protein n=1 Tax=Vairimorpha necatrix TaxID=6039 RepID=A0AAX4JGP5_9MICR